jgi:hypothetical protein
MDTKLLLLREGVTADGVDWWLDLLTRDYTSQITDTQRLVSSIYYSLH